jgi:site-specific recombinase XerD
MATVRRRANLPDDAKLYGCRHAFGTAAVLAGVDVLTLAELMGHTQLETTRWYVHLSGKTDHLVDAMERASRSARD